MRILFATILAAMAAQADFNVRAFGAKGDGAAKDTAAIQRAVDAAHAAGGGRVALRAGVYKSGTIYLKSVGARDLLQRGGGRAVEGVRQRGIPPRAHQEQGAAAAAGHKGVRPEEHQDGGCVRNCGSGEGN